jgi:aryl-alcohol dehydrogenase-like predicted oxidoreductase
VLQTEYSLFAREVEELFPTLEELGIGFVAYSPLARGFLTGAVQPSEGYDASDMRASGGARLPWWQPENFDRNYEIVQRLTSIAESKGASLSQLALAWLLAQGPHVVPIPGSRNPGRVAENTGSAALDLTPADLEAIGAAIGDGPYGARSTTEVVWD